MDLKVLPIAAICCVVMFGYNEDMFLKNKSQKQVVQNIDIDKKEDLDEKKEVDKEKDNDKELELKLKEIKQLYLDRLQEIKDEYEKINSKFQSGEESIATLKDISIKSYEKSQQILNEIYEDLNKYIEKDKMNKIKEEQLNWITKKDEEEKNYNESSSDLILEQKMYYFVEDRCKVLLNYLSNAQCEVNSKNVDSEKDKENNEVIKEENKEDTKENDKEDTATENEMSIDEIISKLHDLLDRQDIKTDYILNEDNNHVKNNPNNPLNVDDYYVFRISDYIEENDGASPDNNILVNKQTLDVYSYGVDGSMEKLGNIK